jgi:hypothetical protein
VQLRMATFSKEEYLFAEASSQQSAGPTCARCGFVQMNITIGKWVVPHSAICKQFQSYKASRQGFVRSSSVNEPKSAFFLYVPHLDASLLSESMCNPLYETALKKGNDAPWEQYNAMHIASKLVELCHSDVNVPLSEFIVSFSPSESDNVLHTAMHSFENFQQNTSIMRAILAMRASESPIAPKRTYESIQEESFIAVITGSDSMVYSLKPGALFTGAEFGCEETTVLEASCASEQAASKVQLLDIHTGLLIGDDNDDDDDDDDDGGTKCSTSVSDCDDAGDILESEYEYDGSLTATGAEHASTELADQLKRITIDDMLLSLSTL